ncbi:MAG: S24 family peptidase [Blastomonas sp.]
MDFDDLTPREALDALIAARGLSYAGVSELLGKNSAYIQQFIKRGTPRKLDEADRRLLAEFFGVAETVLGGPLPGEAGSRKMRHFGANRPAGPSVRAFDLPARMRLIPQLALGASAGAGTLDGDERATGQIAFSEGWLRRMGAGSGPMSMIRVEGDSMAPTLVDGDDIMVTLDDDGAIRRRDGVYVLRMDDVLMVKRLSFRPDGRLSVISDNPLYPGFPDLAPDAVHIVGRVIWAGRRL